MAVGCSCLLLFLIVSVVSGEVIDVKRKVGDDVRLNPEITESLQEKTITWKYLGGGEVIKVIEYDHDFKTTEVLNPKFKERAKLNMNTGELTLEKLKLDHSGLYSIEINNQVKGNTFKLTVMEPVPKPILKEDTQNTGDSNNKYFNCEYATNITWRCTKGEEPKTSVLEKPRHGQFIRLENNGNQDVCCTCTIKNEVSEETSNEVCKKDVFSGNSGVGTIILILVLVAFCICLFIFFIFALLYILYDPFHDNVHDKYKEKTCVKGIISCLETCRKCIRPQTKEDPNKEGEHLKKVNNEQKPEDSEPTGQ